MLKDQAVLKRQSATDMLRGSREKRLNSFLEIQDRILNDLKEEVRNVIEDSQVTKAKYNEMKINMVSQIISDLNRSHEDGHK